MSTTEIILTINTSPVFDKKSCDVLKKLTIAQKNVIKEAMIRETMGIYTKYLDLTKNFSKLFFICRYYNK